jgi:hypothetical protein
MLWGRWVERKNGVLLAAACGIAAGVLNEQHDACYGRGNGRRGSAHERVMEVLKARVMDLRIAEKGCVPKDESGTQVVPYPVPLWDQSQKQTEDSPMQMQP